MKKKRDLEKVIIKRLDPQEMEIKSIDEDKRVIWHRITKEVQDRLGDIVRIDGGDISNFEKKPGVLYGHNYGSPFQPVNPVPVIAENIGFKRKGKSLYAGTRFLSTDGPEAENMSQGLKDLINDNWLLHKMKLMGWSIGFRPTEVKDILDKEGKWIGYDFEKWELLEYSSVIIPAHQDAINDAIREGMISKSFPLPEVDLEGKSNLPIGTIGPVGDPDPKPDELESGSDEPEDLSVEDPEEFNEPEIEPDPVPDEKPEQAAVTIDPETIKRLSETIEGLLEVRRKIQDCIRNFIKKEKNTNG